MERIEFTISNISAKLFEVAEAFGQSAKDTILFENYGKHLLEIDLILKNLGERGRILDVGGGMGVNLLCIQKLSKYIHELYLLDSFKEYTDDNRMGSSSRGLKLMEELKFFVINQDFWLNTKLPFESEFFDIVTIFDVVEHFPGHPLRVFEDIRRILTKGGKIILGGPNSVSITKRIKLLLGKHPYIPFDLWMADKYYSHYREYSPEEYRSLLELSGFKHVRTIMSPEPSKTRACNKYHNGKHSILSPTTIALYGIYILDFIIPKFRSKVYCIGEKP